MNNKVIVSYQRKPIRHNVFLKIIAKGDTFIIHYSLFFIIPYFRIGGNDKVITANAHFIFRPKR